MRILNNASKNIAASIFVLSLVLFILSQLIINSILAPLGTELQSMNGEKNYLIEENRGMEEEIAKSGSITVIQKLADKTLSLSPSNKKTLVYLQEIAIVANK
ncbi:MAG TPA: hypothetical protein PK804_00150 [Candidatus Dojkabacteria bacterium]|jgi:hypothetical protein|uniref:Uncharacterized protein n=1 Tax=Candidatus Dojkabacteria bacterium TaxID=2099670 RepID=A0A847D111_9BACT|nr:hypothetical protein [Candidatus Dojkabacteria bacterium]NLD25414.1 hypothetical protein [Candidatus Dojkabacteria bacterium]HNW32777.1 hypothetical protein [Candidatus Dojkabacteria bacterium]HOZ44614.1 hypothetical protein [Candidatus Dojkabacteria bacterium]HQC39056.1 hypothetical protein [Candidatus Dojkabacteria bacterium]